MKSYKYMGIIYHRRTKSNQKNSWFYYIDDVKLIFKTEELIRDWIETYIMGEF